MVFLTPLFRESAFVKLVNYPSFSQYFIRNAGENSIFVLKLNISRKFVEIILFQAAREESDDCSLKHLVGSDLNVT